MASHVTSTQYRYAFRLDVLALTARCAGPVALGSPSTVTSTTILHRKVYTRRTQTQGSNGLCKQ